MKTNHVQKKLTGIFFASLFLTAASLRAQSAAVPAASQPAVVAPVPQLSDGAAQVLRLAQAKVADDTIISFVKNSPNSYALDAGQIIYLRQQGVSDSVLNVMLNQPKTSAAASTSESTVTTSAGTTITTASGSTATVAPAVTYVQTVPATTYYYQPYCYPSYAWYPPVVLSFGWGWHGGGGWRR